MKLESAKKYIKDNYFNVNKKTIQNVLVALETLSPILEEFEPKHVEKIYQIEQINPSYFPGLSKAAASTLLSLRQSNPRLPLNFIIDIVSDLATRGRPWESLLAFQTFARHCRAEMTQQNLRYLAMINSDIIEIVGSQISNEMNDKEKSVIGQLHKKFSFFSGSTPMQYEKGLRQSLDESFSQFYGHSENRP